MTTTKIDLDELERKARAATPGPWEWDTDPCLYGPPHTVDYGVGPEVERTQIIETDSGIKTDSGFYPPAPADREHIAANSPPVTLALVARIRELEAELVRWQSPCVDVGSASTEWICPTCKDPKCGDV